MSDNLAKRLRDSTEWFHCDCEIKMKCADRLNELEAKVAAYEQRDGMDGAVVSAVRDLLNHHNVPKAAFIDDHVGNAIMQRNIAEANLAKAMEKFAALEKAASDVSRRGAETGPQWTKLTIALLAARTTLAAIQGDAQ